MSRPWRERPIEERAALNPALIATLVAQASAGHMQETEQGMPFWLSYLVVPAVLHAETRSALPSSVRTSLASWTADNPLARASVQRLVGPFAPYVQEGVLLGLRSGALRLDGTSLAVQHPNAVVPRQDLPELHELLKTARLSGRLFGRVGSQSTVFALWGVRP